MIIQPKNPVSLKNLLTLLKSVNETFTIATTDAEAVFYTIDPAKAVLVYATLPKAAMLDYEPEKQLIGFSAKDLLKALNNAKPDSIVRIETTSDGTGIITLNKPFKAKYSVREIAEVEKPVEVGELPVEAYIESYGALFIELIKTAKTLTSEITLYGYTDKAIIKGENLSSQFEITLDNEHDWVKDVGLYEGANEPVKGIYGMAFLNIIARGLTRSHEVTWEWGSYCPLHISYTDPDGFEVNVYVAPRVEDE